MSFRVNSFTSKGVKYLFKKYLLCLKKNCSAEKTPFRARRNDLPQWHERIISKTVKMLEVVSSVVGFGFSGKKSDMKGRIYEGELTDRDSEMRTVYPRGLNKKFNSKLTECFLWRQKTPEEGQREYSSW